jgi:hypothetical protein
MPRRDSNPLPSWRQGIAPGDEPAPAPAPPPQQDDDEYLHGDFSVYNAEWMLQCRATAWVRAAYGVHSPFEWGPRHDRLARKALEQLKRGEALPQISRSSGSVYQPDTQMPGYVTRGFW